MGKFGRQAQHGSNLRIPEQRRKAESDLSQVDSEWVGRRNGPFKSGTDYVSKGKEDFQI